MATEQELQKAVFGGESSMGALGALAGGLKEGVKAFAEGMGKAFDAVQASPTLNNWASHGTTELAAGVLGSGSFLPYGWAAQGAGEKELAAQVFGGQEVSPAMDIKPNAPTMESPQMDQQVKQGGMSM